MWGCQRWNAGPHESRGHLGGQQRMSASLDPSLPGTVLPSPIRFTDTHLWRTGAPQHPQRKIIPASKRPGGNRLEDQWTSSPQSLVLPVACLQSVCCVFQAGCGSMWASGKFYKEGVWLCDVAGLASFSVSAQFSLFYPVTEKASFCCSEMCLFYHVAHTLNQLWQGKPRDLGSRHVHHQEGLDAQLGRKLPGE